MKISDIINEAMSDEDRNKLQALQRRGGEYTKLARYMEPFLQQGEDWDVAAELARQRMSPAVPAPAAPTAAPAPAPKPKPDSDGKPKRRSIDPRGTKQTPPPTKKPRNDDDKKLSADEKVRAYIDKVRDELGIRAVQDLIKDYGEKSEFK